MKLLSTRSGHVKYSFGQIVVIIISFGLNPRSLGRILFLHFGIDTTSACGGVVYLNIRYKYSKKYYSFMMIYDN
jgi:hypothetical protein